MVRTLKRNGITLAVSLLLMISILCAPLASAAVLGNAAQAISVGSQVKIVRGANDYNGVELSRAHYYFDFTVKSISGARATLERTLSIKELEELGVSISSKLEGVLSGLEITSYTLTLDVGLNDLYLASDEAPKDTVTDFESYKRIRVGSVAYIYDAVDYYGEDISPLYTFVDLSVTAINGDRATVQGNVKLNEMIEDFGIELPAALKAAMGFLPSEYLSMDVKKDVKLDNLILVEGNSSNNGENTTGTYLATKAVEAYDKIPSTSGNATRVFTIPAEGRLVIEEVKGKWGRTCVNRVQGYVDLTKLQFITRDYQLISDKIMINDTVNITEDTRMYSDKSEYAYEYLMEEFGFETHEECFSTPFEVQGDRLSYGDRVHLSYFDPEDRVYIAIEVPVSEVVLAEGTYEVDGTITKLFAETDESSSVKKVFTKDSKVVIDSVDGRWGHTYIDGMEGYVNIDTLRFKSGEKELFSDDLRVGDMVKLKKDAKTYFGDDILEVIEEETGYSITKNQLTSAEMKIIDGYSDYIVLFFETDDGISCNFNTNVNSVQFARESEDEIYGDVNGDGKLSMLDVTDLQRSIAKLIDLTDTAEALADVNADDKVNLEDVTDMQKKIAGLIKEFKSEKLN